MALLARWKVAGWAVRRWTCSKARKGSSIPTTVGVLENHLLLQLQQRPDVVITPHAAYYTAHALRDIVENTLANCLRFERRAQWSE